MTILLWQGPFSGHRLPPTTPAFWFNQRSKTNKTSGSCISDAGFRELVARAGCDDQLALHVGTRRDIPRHHFLRLLEIASASVCSKIVAANPRFTDAVRGAVTEVI